MTAELDPRYVAARRILLDALVALTEHTDAIVVAGAQAVYLRTGETDLAVAPYTTDSDLAIDPSELRPDPLLEGIVIALAIAEGPTQPAVELLDIGAVQAAGTVDVPVVIGGG